MHEAMYEVEKGIKACNVFNEKYSEELEYFAVPFVAPGKALEILDYKLYAWPGHGLSVNAPGYQFVEGEYMKVDEYEDIVRDHSDARSGLICRGFSVRLKAFECFRPSPISWKYRSAS